MAQQLFTNNAISLLDIDLPMNVLSFSVIPGDGDLYPQPLHPGDFFLVTIEDQTATYREIIKIIGRSGDTLFIDTHGRGFEGTTIYHWPAGTLVDHRITAYSLNKLGASGSPDYLTVVNPEQIVNADTFQTTFPLSLSCKWIITVLDPISYRTSVCEVLACYRGPLQPPMFTIYARTGDKLLFDIEVDASGTILELNITNTDVIPLSINWLRLSN
jgi:hypothetical protein